MSETLGRRRRHSFRAMMIIYIPKNVDMVRVASTYIAEKAASVAIDDDAVLKGLPLQSCRACALWAICGSPTSPKRQPASVIEDDVAIAGIL